MNNLTFLQDIDLLGWFIITVGIVSASVFLYKLFAEDIVKKHGWESEKMRQRREDHELLIKTSQNLALLQEKSEKDDHGLEVALETFMDEVRDSFDKVNQKFEESESKQMQRKEQSLEIQRNLTDSIKELVDVQKENSEQISALMCGSKELLGNTIDERYEKYIELQGIPQNEVDEFDSIYEAYKGLNGNHGRRTKYEYVKNHLPVIPTKTTLITKEK